MKQKLSNISTIALGLMATLLLPSCFQDETTIHLNKDGSGTLVEETRFGAQMLQMMSGFGGGDDKADPIKEMFSEDKAKARIKELGDGVTFEKSEPVTVNGSKGARVTYHFKDINQLKVNAVDGMKNMAPGGDQVEQQGKKNPPIGFTYANGKLTIKMPIPEKANGADVKKDADKKMDMDNPQAQAMMKQMMSDMKLSLKLVIEPGITESNATHQDGNTITLMEMNFGKLIENPDNMKKLSAMDKEDPAAAMEALKGVDGVKVETKKEVTVKVK